MPFEKVDTQVDFPAQELAILDFWKRIRAFEQRRERNRGGPRWSFLDGPLTANNPMGVHHAWGRTYKDAYQRYFAMTGHELRYQNGFDCQGLWVEVEVEKELKLSSKRDIENLVPGDPFASIDRFVQLCKDRVNKFARIQTAQSIRLGYWMDWDDPDSDADWAKPVGERKSYFTMSEENNYTIWAFLKKCHQRGLIYRGYDAMPWCPRCGVGISEQEMKEGYKLTEHKSVFVKFPLRERPGENLLVWTTTPWTLSSNVGAAVNPELTYLRVKSRGEIYYVAKGAFKFNRMESAGDDDGETPTSGAKKAKRDWLEGVPHLSSIEQLFKSRAKEGYEIVGEVKGSEMLGWTYEGPFDELPAQSAVQGYPEIVAAVVRQQKWAPEVSAKLAHRVIAWDEVGETEGTGIVHIAPGCGREDFELGKALGLPPVAPLDESGVFLEGFGELAGKSAVDPATAEWVFFNLQQKNKLFATERYVHKYPHCWRCKTELLFRLVDEWFINMRWRDEIMKVVEQVEFLPPEINGRARELDWLKNMGDWMISKKRFWGLALPIWVDEQDPEQFEVIGSYEELRERAVEGWSEFEGHSPHRPWVDRVKIRNPRTGNLMARIPDVGNPWLDAGIVPYSTMMYNRNRAEWEKWFPADFITECFPGQFRNWFYAILAMSTMMEQRPPFRTLLGYALVRDQNGEEMHKSKGNSIEFNGAASDGYELFVPRNPKLSPAEQAKKPAKEGGLPVGYISFSEGEVVIDGKPTPVLKGRYRPIGADVIRWTYCRQNPALNINFGPEPTDEVRAKFHLKLWNVYAFLCNYARLDSFDPTQPPLPIVERTDLDRWILSDLQLLIRKAHQAFRSYDIQAIALEAERFVDDKLSNWYLRRSRRRFWKSEQGTEKLAAYQTLYTVMTTLAKLLAPMVPFLTETMWQNLRTVNDPQSVHLCDYPQADESLIDAELSDQMEALLRLVSLGSAARNQAKVKVRQPLAELRIQTSNASEQAAIRRFPELLCEELNLKAVHLHDPATGPLLTMEVKANLKTLGARAGAKLQEIKKQIEASSAEVQALVNGTKAEATLMIDGEPFVVTISDLSITPKGPAGWTAVADRGTHLALDTRITAELAREGMARDVIRQVQDLRKTADLEMEDRIALYLATESANLREAIETHRQTIANETLVVQWLTALPENGAKSVRVKIDGQPLTIALYKPTTTA